MTARCQHGRPWYCGPHDCLGCRGCVPDERFVPLAPSQVARGMALFDPDRALSWGGPVRNADIIDGMSRAYGRMIFESRLAEVEHVVRTARTDNLFVPWGEPDPLAYFTFLVTTTYLIPA